MSQGVEDNATGSGAWLAMQNMNSYVNVFTQRRLKNLDSVLNSDPLLNKGVTVGSVVQISRVKKRDLSSRSSHGIKILERCRK